MKEEKKNDISNVLIQNVIDDESEYIPLISDSEEEALTRIEAPDKIPILPLRNTVLFPVVLIPITVTR